MNSTRIKALAAVLLAATLALPQSTCSGYRGPDGKFVTSIPRSAAPNTYQPAVKREYAYDDTHLNQLDTWFRVCVFLWPLPVLAITKKRRLSHVGRWVWLIEPLLVLVSGWTIWASAAVFGDPAIGAFVALGANLIYLGAWISELWREIIRAPKVQGDPLSHHAAT